MGCCTRRILAVVLLLRIRTLAGGGRGAAAAVSYCYRLYVPELSKIKQANVVS